MIILLITNLLTLTTLILALLKIKQLKMELLLSDALNEQIWDDINILAEDINQNINNKTKSK
jgi:hypothetical protein